MVKIIIIFPIELKFGVTPMLKPDVAYAEMLSNNKSFIGLSPSEKFNKIKLVIMTKKERTIIAKALFLVSSAIRLLKISISFLPLAKKTTFKRAMATVVT